MFKIRSLVLVFSLFFATAAVIPGVVSAQWSFGGGIEFRDESPDFGFHIRTERQFQSNSEILSFAFKLTLGAYIEDNIDFDSVVPDNVRGKADSYYIGGGLFAQIHTPLMPVYPYGGLGGGYETLGFGVEGFEYDGQQFPGFEDDRRSAYLEGFIGLKMGFWQLIKPFVEFRFAQPLDEFEQLEDILGVPNGDITANTRIAFGLMVQI